MKRFKMSLELFFQQKYFKWVVFLQIIMCLFMMVPNIDKYKNGFDFINKMSNLPINNSILFMNKEVYYVGNNAINIQDLKENDKKFTKLINNSEIVKLYSPSFNHIYIVNIENGKEVDYDTFVYDEASLLSIIDEKDINKIKLYKGTNIPILISSGKKDTYKIGDKLDKINKYIFGKEKNELIPNPVDIKFEVVGYFDRGLDDFLDKNIVSNSEQFRLSNIFTEPPIIYDNKIITLYDKKINTLENNWIQPSMRLVYFKDDASEQEIDQFVDNLRKENIGEFSLGKNMIKADKHFLYNRILRNLDAIIGLTIMVIITLFSISLINKSILKKRLNIYLINGAKKKDIYWITHIYYSIMVFIPIIIYSIFSFISENEYMKNNVEFFTNALFNYYIISISGFIIMIVFAQIYIAIITYVTIKDFDSRKYIESYREL